ncbi:MAG: hypothetical protein KA767_17285, partial [Saprospiraceae bacterium]|nr:hypothetical protein [Saprospiraceae bacterium]
SHGALKTEMTEATFKKRNSPYISFFLDRNPGFVNGDELVCIVPLTPENLIRSAREYCDLGLVDDLENVS